MLKRLDSLIRLLSSPQPPRTREAIAKKLGIHLRTVQRDLDFLREKGYDVHYNKERGITCKSPKTKQGDILSGHDEMLPSLILIRALLHTVWKLDSSSSADILTGQINGLLDKMGIAADQLSHYVSSASPIMSQRLVPTFRTLVKGVIEKKIVRIKYKGYKDANARSRDVCPLHLFEAEGRWHCLALCKEKREERTFALWRMDGAELLEEAFQRPPKYDTSQTWEQRAEAFGIWSGATKPQKVRVKMWGYAAALIRESSHRPSAMKIKDWPGDKEAVEVIFKAHELEKEVLPWLLKWGPCCKVISPESLKKQMHDHLQEIAALYADEPATKAKQI